MMKWRVFLPYGSHRHLCHHAHCACQMIVLKPNYPWTLVLHTLYEPHWTPPSLLEEPIFLPLPAGKKITLQLQQHPNNITFNFFTAVELGSQCLRCNSHCQNFIAQITMIVTQQPYAKNSWNVFWSEATSCHCRQFLGEARIDSIIGVSLEVVSISEVKTEMFTSST